MARQTVFAARNTKWARQVLKICFQNQKKNCQLPIVATMGGWWWNASARGTVSHTHEKKRACHLTIHWMWRYS